jgi:Family of unknown function (DUF6263)
MFIYRLLAGLAVLGIVTALSIPAQGQDKKADDKGKTEAKKDEKKPDDKKPDEKKPDEKKPDDKKSETGKAPVLKWKFEKDKTFYQTMTTTTKQTMKVMNNDVTQNQKQTFWFSWKPLEVTADKVVLEQKIENVAMDIDIGGSKISYDSTKKEGAASNPLGDFFKALKDSTFKITLDPKTGKVTDVEGRDAFITKLTAANPQMKSLLDQILSKDSLKEMAEPTFAVMPEKEGATEWKKTTTLDMGPIGKYENTYNYKIEGTEGKLVKIKVDTNLTYKAPADNATGSSGLPFKIKSADLKSSNAGGTITFDTEKGRVAKSNTKIELKGKLSIEIGGQQTVVDLSQTQESTVETSDENPVKK